MSKRSASIQSKLDKLFIADAVTEEFGTMLNGSLSPVRFDSQKQLANYLCEGSLLNINYFASKALSIPAGEYMVWVTDVGSTMLVPTKNENFAEVFEDQKTQFEILTPNLVQHWSKIEKVLAEDFGQDSAEGGGGGGGESGDKTDNAPEGSAISSRVDPADIDRNPILRAMEDRGFTVTSLATACGVQPPAISRILRTPKDRQGDPGGRNPSMGLAAVISKNLRMDPTALFPDIFNAGQDMKARKTPGNRGSGVTNAAAGSTRKGGNDKWSSGSPSSPSPTLNASFDNTLDAILENNLPGGFHGHNPAVPQSGRPFPQPGDAMDSFEFSHPEVQGKIRVEITSDDVGGDTRFHAFMPFGSAAFLFGHVFGHEEQADVQATVEARITQNLEFARRGIT